MTVIAALARAGRVHMAADTASQIDGTFHHNDQKLCTLPIANSDERIVMGFAGNGAIKSLVRRHLKVDDVPAPDEDSLSWALAIAEAICSLVTDADPRPVTQDGWIDGTGLMGFRGDIWLLNHQTALRLTLPYSAIGSGGDLALGVLHTRSDDPDPVAVLEAAVQTACTFDSGCRVLEAGAVHMHA